MRIGLGGFHQQPFAEFVNGGWRIYVSYNKDVSGGTYLALSPVGVCDRVVFDDGYIVNVDRIAHGAVPPPP